MCARVRACVCLCLCGHMHVHCVARFGSGHTTTASFSLYPHSCYKRNGRRPTVPVGLQSSLLRVQQAQVTRLWELDKPPAVTPQSLRRIASPFPCCPGNLTTSTCYELLINYLACDCPPLSETSKKGNLTLSPGLELIQSLPCCLPMELRPLLSQGSRP